MTVSIYKIRRTDGLEYIGITNRTRQRFAEHKRSRRFEIGIDSIVILETVETYEEAEDLEEYYIDHFDTFESGLNVTTDGKGLNGDCKFNTLGYKFSKESRERMSESAKRRGSDHLVNYTFNEDDKKHLSKVRKGIYWGANEKISECESYHIYSLYQSDEIDFDVEFLRRFVKRSQKCDVDKIDFSELKSINGKLLSKKTLYSHYLSDKYNVTPNAIRRIIDKEGKRCPKNVNTR